MAAAGTAAQDSGDDLPPLPRPPAKEMAGPTEWSNWVIPGRVIAGAYPASLDDEDTDHVLTLLLELGMNTFVCLQAEVNIHVPEHAWRAGHGLRPYIRDAQRILSRAHEVRSTRITQQRIDFLHLPVIDGSVTTDSAMHRLAEDCCERVLRGEKMYIHCWGGHGRTGTLVATMLSRLYGLPYTSALRYTQAYHDSRVYPQGVRSPQTPVQRAQVRRLLALPSPTARMRSSMLLQQRAAVALQAEREAGEEEEEQRAAREAAAAERAAALQREQTAHQQAFAAHLKQQQELVQQQLRQLYKQYAPPADEADASGSSSCSSTLTPASRTKSGSIGSLGTPISAGTSRSIPTPVKSPAPVGRFPGGGSIGSSAYRPSASSTLRDGRVTSSAARPPSSVGQVGGARGASPMRATSAGPAGAPSSAGRTGSPMRGTGAPALGTAARASSPMRAAAAAGAVSASMRTTSPSRATSAAPSTLSRSSTLASNLGSRFPARTAAAPSSSGAATGSTFQARAAAAGSRTVSPSRSMGPTGVASSTFPTRSPGVGATASGRAAGFGSRSASPSRNFTSAPVTPMGPAPRVAAGASGLSARSAMAAGSRSASPSRTVSAAPSFAARPSVATSRSTSPARPGGAPMTASAAASLAAARTAAAAAARAGSRSVSPSRTAAAAAGSGVPRTGASRSTSPARAAPATSAAGVSLQHADLLRRLESLSTFRKLPPYAGSGGAGSMPISRHTGQWR